MLWQDVKVFRNTVELISTRKMKTQNLHKFINYPTHNDVVLDKIAEINVIGVENNPKMYDLTIPSTLTQVRTSSTGYIQKTIK